MLGNAIGTYLKIAALTTAGLAVFPVVGVADDAVHRAEPGACLTHSLRSYGPRSMARCISTTASRTVT